MAADVGLGDVGLSPELLDCISQVLKKPTRRSAPLERLLSQQQEQQEQDKRQRDALAARGRVLSDDGDVASPDAAAGGANAEARVGGDYARNREMLHSVREIAGYMEDERARTFFNASGNLETLLGPEQDDVDMLPETQTHISAFGEPDESALRARERAGLNALMRAPLTLPSPASPLKKRRDAVASEDEDDDDDRLAEAVHASLAGGWLVESMELRNDQSRNAIAGGLFDIASASGNRLLSSEAARSLCAIMGRAADEVSTSAAPFVSKQNKRWWWLPSYNDIRRGLTALGYLEDVGVSTTQHSLTQASREPQARAAPPIVAVPFNVKSILRVARCIAALPAKYRPTEDINSLVFVALRLGRDKGTLSMQNDVRETLASLLACLGAEEWDAVKDSIAAHVAGARPSALAAVECVRTLKSALLIRGAQGRERWVDFRLIFATSLLCERLGMAREKGEGEGEGALIASVGEVVHVVDALRALNLTAIFAAWGADDGVHCEDGDVSAYARTAASGWDILAAIRAVDVMLEDARPDEIDEVSMSMWIDLLQHLGKSIRGSRSSLELLMKAAVTELCSRYSFIASFNCGNFAEAPPTITATTSIDATPSPRRRSRSCTPLRASGLFDAAIDDDEAVV